MNKSTKKVDKIQGILSDSMRNVIFVESSKTRKTAQYKSRLLKKVTKSLDDLAFIAENISEKDLQKIYMSGALNRFIRALFKIDFQAETHEKRKRVKLTREMLRKRARLSRLAKDILHIITDPSFMRNLLPEHMQKFVRGGLGIHSIDDINENTRLLFYISLEAPK